MLTTQAPGPYLDYITRFVLSPLDLPSIRKACLLGCATVQFASALAECQPYCEVRHLLQLCHRLARSESPEFSWFASAVAQMIHLGPSAIEKFHLPTLQLGVRAWSAAATTDLTDCIRHSKSVLGHAGLENLATYDVAEAVAAAMAASGSTEEQADALAAQKAREKLKAHQLKSTLDNHSLEQLGKYVHLLGEMGVELDLDWQNMCEQLCMAAQHSLLRGYIQSVDLEGVTKPDPNMNAVSYTHATTMQLLPDAPVTHTSYRCPALTAAPRSHRRCSAGALSSIANPVRTIQTPWRSSTDRPCYGISRMPLVRSE